MENIKQFTVDYLEGRIEPHLYSEALLNDPSVLDWLQSIVPEGKIGYFEKVVRPDGSWYQRTGPYSIHHAIKAVWSDPGHSRLGRELNTFSVISRLMSEAFPELELNLDTTLSEKYHFVLNACPEYLCSVEIENAGILEKLMEEFPDTMPKSKRVKAFRNKLKQMFYVEGQKYPRWIQESEWPLSKTGKPTKFLKQKSKGEVSFYYFLDVDTGEEIEIMQAY